jgi:hypothetical protein
MVCFLLTDFAFKSSVVMVQTTHVSQDKFSWLVSAPEADPGPARETEWDQKETHSSQDDTYQRHRLTTDGSWS